MAVTVGKMLGDAVKWGVLARNVASQADPPAVAHPTMECWTPAQLRTFLAHVASDRLYPMWLTLITTGMRRGEVAGLTWDNLDLDAGELHVRSTRTVVDYQVHEGDPKTDKSRRAVSLDAITVAALRRWKLASPPQASYVFATELGEPIHPERITKMFQAHAKAAGLPVIPLHGLRHSYASAALEAGVDLTTVSRQLGHSSLAITADIYSKVSDRLRQTSANLTAGYILGEAL